MMEGIWLGVLFFLSAAGCVQIVGWLIRQFTRPKNRPQIFELVIVDRNTQNVEQQLRWAYSHTQWRGSAQVAKLVVVNMGADEQTLQICQHLASQLDGIQIVQGADDPLFAHLF